jgi:hypothetical protein
MASAKAGSGGKGELTCIQGNAILNLDNLIAIGCGCSSGDRSGSNGAFFERTRMRKLY